MRWPWISRDWFDYQRDSLNAQIASQVTRATVAEQNLAASEARFKELLALYHERTALPVAPLVPEPLALVPRDPDPIQDAIREEANGDPRLASYFRRRATQLKHEGKSIPQIVAAIHTWESVGDPIQAMIEAAEGRV